VSAFRVTITVGEGDLGKVLAGLTRKQIADADIVPVKNEPEPDVQQRKVCPTGRAAGATILMKGDRTDTPSLSSLRNLLRFHEELEASLGIGTVTRSHLTEVGRKKIGSFRSGLITKLIKEGYLVYVTGGE